MKGTIVLIIFIVSVILLGYILNFQGESFEQKRTRILNELLFAIKEAKTDGNYGCCINPPCTMCYLGEWIWKDGVCRCDEMIAKGEFDKVCPQCKRGIEEGRCISDEKWCKK